MDLIDYIYDECHRQHVTNYGDFAMAWEIARGGPDYSVQDFKLFVDTIARFVEPTKNYDGLRTSHVGFLHGGSAAPVNEVRPRFDRWCGFVFANKDAFNDPDFVDYCIKQLLEIHPWVDGNGRTCSILRNWMLGTLDDPQPLPYYDFGG